MIKNVPSNVRLAPNETGDEALYQILEFTLCELAGGADCNLAIARLLAAAWIVFSQTAPTNHPDLLRRGFLDIALHLSSEIDVEEVCKAWKKKGLVRIFEPETTAASS